MPDSRLTVLPAATAPESNDILYIVNDNISKSITLNTLANNLPSVSVSGNVNVDGNIIIGQSSSIIGYNRDYAWDVYDTIKSQFVPASGEDFFEYTTNYTVLTSHGGLTHSINSSNTVYIEVPNQVNYNGFKLSFIQVGTGNVVLSAGPGVTVGSLNDSLTAAGQYAKVELTYIGNQLYTLTGDLST